ncbi:MAG: DNA-directed RNA polymerase subunit omega [Candidatus Methanodesulfokora sp.]
METKNHKNIFSKFEEVRIIAARAQQIAAGAPLLLREDEIPSGLSDPVELAKLEYKLGRLPVYIERK